MADIAGSYLAGIRSGEELGSDLTEPYQRAKAWQEKLKDKAEAHEMAAEALKVDASRYADKLKLEQEHQTETKRHNEAVEKEWLPGSRGGKGAGGMNHDRVFLQKQFDRYSEIMKDHPEDMSAEDLDSMHQLAKQLRSAANISPYEKPADEKKPVEEKRSGLMDGIAGAAKSAMNFFHSNGIQDPPAQTMKGTMNGKRVTLTKTASGWVDESGQVVK